MSIARNKRFAVLQRDKHTCRYCGRKAPDVQLEVDHIHPRSAGGTDKMENLITACYDCNRGKAASITKRTIKLVGGPMPGEAIESDELFPILWVYRVHDGSLYYVKDGWRVVLFQGKRLCSYFPKGGHPMTGQHTGEQFREANDRFKKPYPVLIGMYGWQQPSKYAYEVTELDWHDPDVLLLRLTDLAYTFTDTENPWNEASIYYDEGMDWDGGDANA